MPAIVAVLGLTLLGGGLRLHQLTFQPLWWDEGISVYLSALGAPAVLWDKVFDFDIHPPLYYLLLQSWTRFAGHSVLSARLFTALLGTLCLPLAYQVARRWLGTPAALLAALLAAVSPFLIHYSQEARMYGLVPALCLAAVVAWERANGALDAGKPWRAPAALWVGLSALGLYAYYYTLWWVGAQVAASLFRPGGARRCLRWAGLAGLAGLLAAPWGLVLLGGPAGWWGNGVGQAPPAGLGPFLEVTWLAFSVGFAVVPPYTDLIAGLALAIALFGFALGPWRAPGARWRALTLAVVPVALSFAMLQVREFYFPRLVLPVTFVALAFVGSGLAFFTQGQRALAVLLLAMLLASDAVSLAHEWRDRRTAFAPDDYLSVLGTVRAAGPGDAMLCAQSWQCGYALAYLAPARFPVRAVELAWLRDPARLDREVEAALGGRSRFWLLDWSPDGSWAGRELEQSAGRLRPPVLIDQLGDTRAALFSSSPVRLEAAALGLRPVGADFGAVIRLAGYGLDPADALGPGQRLRLTLLWQALAPPDRDFTVFNQLLSPDQRVVAQRDAPPLAGTAPTSAWTPGLLVVDRYAIELPPDTPAAEVDLITGLYDPRSGQRLATRDGDFVRLAGLRLGR